MTARLTTDAELADVLGITVGDVRHGCLRKGWPCVRPKRSVWRFTDEQVAAIVAMESVTPARKVGAIAGQTKRSQKRGAA